MCAVAVQGLNMLVTISQVRGVNNALGVNSRDIAGEQLTVEKDGDWEQWGHRDLPEEYLKPHKERHLGTAKRTVPCQSEFAPHGAKIRVESLLTFTHRTC